MLLQVVLRVDWNVVLQHVDGVLRQTRAQMSTGWMEKKTNKWTFFGGSPQNLTSDFMYAAAPLAALMMTYGTRSPRLGALPASLFLILECILYSSLL